MNHKRKHPRNFTGLARGRSSTYAFVPVAKGDGKRGRASTRRRIMAAAIDMAMNLRFTK